AVVVDPVARFRPGLHVLHALDRSGAAERGPGRAHPRLAGVARASAAGVALVDLAVAVVVEPVAQLRRGLHALGAGDRGVGASEDAVVADPGQAGGAGPAAAGVALVDLAVAVVVLAVADLGGGLHVLGAGERAVRAQGGPGAADAGLARGARRAAAGVAVV